MKNIIFILFTLANSVGHATPQGTSFGSDFAHKNVVWAAPNCENPRSMTTWAGNATLYRYQLSRDEFSKTKVDSVDVGPNGEAAFSENVDSKSREVLFVYKPGEHIEVVIMNSKWAQPVFEMKGPGGQDGGFPKLVSCNPNSVAAKKIFEAINNPSSVLRNK